ncbi:MAG: UDP-2,3-diacylglucosamine diphosphatase LpxI [Acidobacteriota bacterium]
MQERPVGIIAGNGPLPVETAREALRQGRPVVIAAILEEADPVLDQLAAEYPGRLTVEWLGVGQLGKLLKLFHRHHVGEAVMVGQVRHVRIFAPRSRAHWSDLRRLPDLKTLRLLRKLPSRNTAAILEAFIGVLEQDGLRVLDSTTYLRHWLADSGPLTRRGLTEEERKDIEYGLPVAREIARLDVGQSIVVRDQVVVAVEAMEGTDAAVRRAAELARGARLTLIKVSRPNQDFRYDVPVVGPRTLEVCRECGVTAICVEAGRTLLVEKESFLRHSDELGLAVVGTEAEV